MTVHEQIAENRSRIEGKYQFLIGQTICTVEKEGPDIEILVYLSDGEVYLAFNTIDYAQRLVGQTIRSIELRHHSANSSSLCEGYPWL